MGKDNSKRFEPQSDNIEQIMRERQRLDQVIKEKFQKKMAIIFSDVSGYTKYMDTWGDIRGRVWIQKHNDIVLPVIESHGGDVLSIMGDGVMAAFSWAASWNFVFGSM